MLKRWASLSPDTASLSELFHFTVRIHHPRRPPCSQTHTHTLKRLLSLSHAYSKTSTQTRALMLGFVKGNFALKLRIFFSYLMVLFLLFWEATKWIKWIDIFIQQSWIKLIKIIPFHILRDMSYYKVSSNMLRKHMHAEKHN